MEGSLPNGIDHDIVLMNDDDTRMEDVEMSSSEDDVSNDENRSNDYSGAESHNVSQLQFVYLYSDCKGISFL